MGTTFKEIIDNAKEMNYDYEIYETIKEEKVVVVFISTYVKNSYIFDENDICIDVDVEIAQI